MMLRTLLKILLLPPDLLLSHVHGYADLAGEVGGRYLGTLRNRCLMFGMSALSLLLALILGGVALLLWSAFPLNDAPHVWVLMALPALFLFLSAWCGWWAYTQQLPSLLGDIQAQIELDLQAIRQVHSP